MSSRLVQRHHVFSEKFISTLNDNNIRTVLDFLHEAPEDICKILELSFKEVSLIRENVVAVLRQKPCKASDLLKQSRESRFTLQTGIQEIDQLIGGLESGSIYEICGLSGSGKTQICFSIAAHISSTKRKVLFIDTKNDFSASRVFKILRKKCDADLTAGMERIKVTRAFNLHKIGDVLHSLQGMDEFRSCSVIIIDCISTAYFAYVGGARPVGYAMLNYIASLMKYIAARYCCVFIMTNLASNSFRSVDNRAGTENLIKPCMGSYWQQISDCRIDLKKKDNSVISVSIEKSNTDVNENTYNVNLASL